MLLGKHRGSTITISQVREGRSRIDPDARPRFTTRGHLADSLITSSGANARLAVRSYSVLNGPLDVSLRQFDRARCHRIVARSSCDAPSTSIFLTFPRRQAGDAGIVDNDLIQFAHPLQRLQAGDADETGKVKLTEFGQPFERFQAGHHPWHY